MKLSHIELFRRCHFLMAKKDQKLVWNIDMLSVSEMNVLKC